jgi:RimJ/RimL family protein N-acetyltransferase
MYNGTITIKETMPDDLANVLALWNDGEVMKFVGFPEGLGETMEGMTKWLGWIDKGRPKRNHYSVYAEGIGYCGEAFYNIDSAHSNTACLDIKLFPIARGKGIAAKALSYAIEQAFANGAFKVWVDPNPDNEKALALYRKLGFAEKGMPDYLKENETSGSVNFVPVYMEKER